MTSAKTQCGSGKRNADSDPQLTDLDPQPTQKKYTDKGYVLFSRKWLGRELAQCPGAFVVYFHLVAWANHENGKLKRGQIALGERDFGLELSMSVTTVRKWLRWLEANGWIKLKPERHGKQRGTIVTVLRYEASQTWAAYRLSNEEQEASLLPPPPHQPSPLPASEYNDAYLRISAKHNFANPETAAPAETPTPA